MTLITSAIKRLLICLRMINTKFKQTEIGEIPKDWNLTRLGQVSKPVQGLAINSKSKHLITTKENGLPLLRIKDLLNNNEEIYINDKNAPKQTIVDVGDILFTRTGQVGFVFKNRRGVLHNNCFKVVPNDSIDKEYLYWFLKQKHIKDYINSVSSGSAQPDLSHPAFNSILFSYPPLVEQKNIASILSSLDDKIELNQKTIKTLEEIGQTLFKRWFIDFEFPNEKGEPFKSSGGEMVDSELGEIPKGWSVSNLESIGTFLNGLALQKYPKNGEEFLYAIKIRELNKGITENTDKVGVNLPEEYIVVDGDLLFSWSGSLDIVIWGEGKGALNQHLFKVTSSIYPKWFIYNWIKQFIPFFQMIASSKATTMGHIQRKHLAEALVSIPPQEIINNADKLITPLFNSIIKYKQEIQTLTQIKDLLLPKLLSGKIRIS